MKIRAGKSIGFLIMLKLVSGWGGYDLPAQAAEKAERFYQGKTITWVVSAEPGGSTDITTRILAPHLAREIGARIVVKNMTGGSLQGDNWVYNEAKKDGLTLLTEGKMPLLLNDLLKLGGVKYVTQKFLFVSGVDPELSAFAVSPKSPYKTLDALRKAKGLKVGASTAKGYIAISGAVMLEILGLDGKVVTGYQGMKSVLLDMARGQLDIVANGEAAFARAEKDGYLITLFIIGDERSPLFPNLPTLRELGVDIPKELLDAYQTVSANTHLVALPPGVDADRVAYLRKIFKKMSELKDIQRDISRWAGVWRSFIPGEKMQEDIDHLMANKSLATQLETIRKKHSAVQ